MAAWGTFVAVRCEHARTQTNIYTQHRHNNM